MSDADDTQEMKVEPEGETEMITFEVTLKGTIEITVPKATVPKLDELAADCPIEVTKLPQELWAEFEEKLANQSPDFDYEITGIF